MKLLSDKRKLKKESETAKRKKEELMQELKEVQKSLDRAYENFSYVVDPELIDCCIYELNAGQMRYKFLMRKMKEDKFL
ncbi:MAG: DUF2508 family protein [Candidatus Gastranaerophilaceae bacterium]|nr:putative uncharacterized protein [Roseburia sp. CAG:303]